MDLQRAGNPTHVVAISLAQDRMREPFPGSTGSRDLVRVAASCAVVGLAHQEGSSSSVITVHFPGRLEVLARNTCPLRFGFCRHLAHVTRDSLR